MLFLTIIVKKIKFLTHWTCELWRCTSFFNDCSKNWQRNSEIVTLTAQYKFPTNHWLNAYTAETKRSKWMLALLFSNRNYKTLPSPTRFHTLRWSNLKTQFKPHRIPIYTGNFWLINNYWGNLHSFIMELFSIYIVFCISYVSITLSQCKCTYTQQYRAL